jgi:hypothetical protein
MYIDPEYFRGVKRFDRNQFRPMPVSRDARKRANAPKPSDVAARLS